VYSFLAADNAVLPGGYSNTLAKVLFWCGAGPLLLVAVALVGEWLSRLRHEGHVNGAWQVRVRQGLGLALWAATASSWVRACRPWKA
jgi:hypothetical protein